MFKEGDIVVCIENAPMVFGTVDYTNKLTIGNTYTVLKYWTGPSPSIEIRDDNGDRRQPFASRFLLAEEHSGSAGTGPVIRKIRQMEAKRKSLGYKW